MVKSISGYFLGTNMNFVLKNVNLSDDLRLFEDDFVTIRVTGSNLMAFFFPVRTGGPIAIFFGSPR
jgi:hypothetical protein